MVVVLSHSCGSLWKNHHVFVRKLKRRHLLTTISSLITWSKPSFLLDAALQHCWVLASPEPNISTCQDVAMWQNFVRWWQNCFQHVVELCGVPNMLATMFAKWSLTLTNSVKRQYTVYSVSYPTVLTTTRGVAGVRIPLPFSTGTGRIPSIFG